MCDSPAAGKRERAGCGDSADESCHRTGTTAFAICERCGRVEEFAEPVIAQKLRGWSKSTGFVPSRMTVELRGLCAGCAKAASSRA